MMRGIGKRVSRSLAIWTAGFDTYSVIYTVIVTRTTYALPFGILHVVSRLVNESRQEHFHKNCGTSPENFDPFSDQWTNV